VGDTTLGLGDFIDLWKNSEVAIGDLESFIYGNTPMCEALRKAKERFTKERNRVSSP
jgi:hypothetical protein